MSILALDLGGTKLASAVLSEDGVILTEERTPLGKRKGCEVGLLVALQVEGLLASQKEKSNEISSIGISVPGICYQKNGTVWAPNIPGWEKYPLAEEIKQVAGDIPVIIDSDRACSIVGEVWKGSAKGCCDAIFVAVGTGIGAGILVNGKVLRGANDIAGSIGWMALERPFQLHYVECGCFESRASGDGIAKLAREILMHTIDYHGLLKNKSPDHITAYDIFQA
ncbi:MAG: ROK family protein, partial [Ferruginibacter sp.]